MTLAGAEKPVIALVSMPWALFNRPSIQLGALKAYLLREWDGEVLSLHPYLEVAAELGRDDYRRISLDGWAGEALYGPLVLPERKAAAAALYRRQLPHAPDFEQAHRLVRGQLLRFIDQVDWQRFSLVGFSVCFFQLMPTLAAVRMIRKKAPQVRIVLGGSLFSPESARAVQREFPEIDRVVCGEGEAALLALCRGDELPEDHGQLAMRELPRPDFSDYFHQAGRIFQQDPLTPEIPVEFSRGCWWNRCRFCNLNLQWHGYRRHRAEEVFARVEYEAERGSLDFTFTDNVLPRDEAGPFFDLAGQSGRDYAFFAEVRAEQRGEFARFRKGGLREVQVGIEALSDSLLTRMAKGGSVLANLAAMKKARECGITLSGNLICEFPGSTAAEVEETLATIDLAWPYAPLDPAAFFLGDGSPIAADPRAYGIRAVLPHQAYSALLGHGLARDLALPVRGYRGDRTEQKRLWQPVREKIARWHEFHRQRRLQGKTGPALTLRDGGSFLLIRQEKADGKVLLHRLKGLSREIYLAGADVCRIEQLLASRSGLDSARLISFLKELEDKKLLCRRGGSFLSLAVRETEDI